MAKIEMISGGRRVNGVDLTTAQYNKWKAAGSPSNVRKWVDSGMPGKTTSSGSSSGGSSSGGSSSGGSPGAVVKSATGGSTNSSGNYDNSGLTGSQEFQRLSEEDQAAVLAVFGAIAGNDKVQAERLAEAFKAASKINDPYFGQQLRLAVDAIERGYVSIDEEAQFAAQQIETRLADFREDFERKKEFMTLELASVMKEIDRAYEQNLETLQTNLATSGFTSSSRRTKKEGLLNEATGDLRESKNRSFAFQTETDEKNLLREERDTQREIERLHRLTEEQKLDFLRTGEQKVGTDNLPTLPGAPDPLKDIYGQIPADKLQNTISAATSFVF